MDINVSLILSTFLVFLISYTLLKVYRAWKWIRLLGAAADQFPGRAVHWLYGTVHLYPGPDESGLAHQRRSVKMFPRVERNWIGFWQPVIGLHHPDTYKLILRTSEPKPFSSGMYRFGKPWLGDGLLFSHGAKWARNRKLLTNAFHFEILKPYMDVYNQASDIFVDKMSEAVQKGKPFEIFNNISLCTLDVILRCAFSYANDVQTKGTDHPYVRAVNDLSDIWMKRAINPLLWPNWIFYFTSNGRLFRKQCKFVHSVSEEIILKRKTTLSTASNMLKNQKYLDFLDILLTAADDTGAGLTDQEIRDEVDTFMFAGHDTTASSISWTLYSLAGHPEHQEKCKQEIDGILANKQQSDIAWEDLTQLKYLTMCIKESMRLNCPVHMLERELTSDLMIDGIMIPAGSIIELDIYNIHHNPTVWDEPMEFRPSRFSPENQTKMDPYAFVPFSAGPRNCIGQNFAMNEQKVIISKIVHRFSLALDPNFKVEKKLAPVMKTQNGMYLKVFPRNGK